MTGLALAQVGWDDEVARRLRDDQQAELRALYGDDDIGTAMDGSDVVVMLVGRLDGTAVACGALRDASDLGAGYAELKRMYVVPSARGQRLSRQVLISLEDRAHALGYTRIVLETGARQLAAVPLYTGAGYLRIARYPPYEDEDESLCYAKDLVR